MMINMVNTQAEPIVDYWQFMNDTHQRWSRVRWKEPIWTNQAIPDLVKPDFAIVWFPVATDANWLLRRKSCRPPERRRGTNACNVADDSTLSIRTEYRRVMRTCRLERENQITHQRASTAQDRVLDLYQDYMQAQQTYRLESSIVTCTLGMSQQSENSIWSSLSLPETRNFAATAQAMWWPVDSVSIKQPIKISWFIIIRLTKYLN